ncbi:ngoFVII restriction endonuclease [Prevotella sp. CAG:1092]|nr:ngoFVII restriction endonuclease [Prevotella sp. CAG:1092]
MLYYKNLDKTVLEMLHNTTSSNNIVIVSGYVGYQTIKMLCEQCCDVRITVVYGMYGSERISQPLHLALMEVQRQYSNITILYSTIPVHSKIYTWNCDAKIEKALVGSANFSISGMMNDYKEVLSDVEQDTYSTLKEYCDYVLSKAISCNDAEVKFQKVFKASGHSKLVQPLLAKNVCRATLLDRNGMVSKKSGLNWGLSNGHVSEGDAYIRITSNYIKLFPSLFPPKKYVGMDNPLSNGKKNRENDEVELIWDDGEKMIGLLEGQQTKTINGLVYPKQLSTSPSKSILGKYLRKRLGVDLNHTITKSDLLRYGRTSIDISLVGEGIYYLDFSVK